MEIKEVKDQAVASKAAHNPKMEVVNIASLSKDGLKGLPELVVYWDKDFGGAQYRTNLNHLYVGDYWNDQISSIVIVSGKWQFYIDDQYRTPAGAPLGPGYYSWVVDYGIPNDIISSFKCVGLTD